MGGGRKEKIILADIHLSIVPRPGINITKPDSVTVAEVSGRELMILVEPSNQDIHGLSQSTGFGIIHNLFGSDAEPTAAPGYVIQVQIAPPENRMYRIGHLVSQNSLPNERLRLLIGYLEKQQRRQ